jgi:hypothetical protein
MRILENKNQHDCEIKSDGAGHMCAWNFSIPVTGKKRTS